MAAPQPQVGAVAGLLVCHLVRAAAAAAGYTGAPPSLPVYGVVGAGATLSGCLRYKATAVLITVEATGAWSLIVPVVIAGALLRYTPSFEEARPCWDGQS